MNERNDGGNGDGGLPTAQAWVLGLVVGAVVLALMGVAYVIGFNQGEDEGGPVTEAKTATEAPAETTEAPPATPEPTGPGKELFVSNCGSCHVLAAADTSGTIGPDLDDLTPDQQQVLAAIENGGAGGGAMPAGLLEGAEAEQVAQFVADSAGQKPAG